MNLLPLVEEQYRADIKEAYQRKMSKYDSLVTLESGVIGDSTYFNTSTAGGEAQAKAFLGRIPRIGGGLDRVKCDLTTEYASDEIDEQQLSKTKANGELIIAINTMAAIERKRDSKIIAAMDTTTSEIVHGSTGFTQDKVEELWQLFSDNLVFEYGETPIVSVGTKQWIDLMSIDEFKNADYIGPGDMPFIQTKAQQGRFWYDMIFRVDPKLPVNANIRKCFAHVPSAVGLALSADKKSRVLETENDTILYYTREKNGAVLIDPNGCVEIQCSEAAPST